MAFMCNLGFGLIAKKERRPNMSWLKKKKNWGEEYMNVYLSKGKVVSGDHQRAIKWVFDLGMRSRICQAEPHRLEKSRHAWSQRGE